jgi:hypothetical protein
MHLRRGIVIHSFIHSVPGVLFFISVLGHYPRFAHPCYRNVLSRVGGQGPTSAGDVCMA